jgi:hypothetical protein
MSALLIRLAAACVRGWTRVYTWRLRAEVRDVRSREVESDLWESQNDPDLEAGVALAVTILGRLVSGMPDDVKWRREQGVVEPMLVRRRVSVALAVAGLLVAWLVLPTRADLPSVPDSPRIRWSAHSAYPPPPPPPPPPCAPPGFGGPRECSR